MAIVQSTLPSRNLVELGLQDDVIVGSGKRQLNDVFYWRATRP